MTRYIWHDVNLQLFERDNRWNPLLTFAVTISVSVALWIGIAAIVWRVI